MSHPQRLFGILLLVVVALAGMPASWGAEPVAERNYYSVQLQSAPAAADLRTSLALVADQPYARVEKRGSEYALRVGFWENREEAQQAAKALLPNFRAAHTRIAPYQPEAIVARAGEQPPIASAPLPSTEPRALSEAASGQPANAQAGAAARDRVAADREAMAQAILREKAETEALRLAESRGDAERRAASAALERRAADERIAQEAMASAQAQREAERVAQEKSAEQRRLIELVQAREQRAPAEAPRPAESRRDAEPRPAPEVSLPRSEPAQTQAQMPEPPRGSQLAVGRDYFSVQLHSARTAADLQEMLALAANQPYARIDRRGTSYALRVGFWEKREEAQQAAKALLPKFPGAYARVASYRPDAMIVASAGAPPPKASAPLPTTEARAQEIEKPIAAPAPVPTAPAQAPPIARDALPPLAREFPPAPVQRTPPAPAETTPAPTTQTYLPAPSAASLVFAFRAAKDFDPQYRAALAEKTFIDSTATASQLAYTPQLQYTQQQFDYANASRSTWSISQPVVSGDKFFSFRQAGPRALLADSTLAQRDQDLAQRLLRSVTEFVRAREATRTIEFQIGLYKEQAAQAQRMFDLGRATITDVRDTAVRFEQARATQLAVVTRLQVAENQFAAITGSPPAKESFAIVAVPRRFDLETQERYAQDGQSNNPQIAVARQTERIADLEAQRAKAALLPTISAIGVRTESAGITSQFAGVAVSFPLQGQTFTQISGARAQADRAREQRRQTEQSVHIDIERLRALVESGQQELIIRKQAIVAAELAVQSNIKSQQGGVRTTVDVLNSIQTLASVRNDYANTAATLAENYLSLLLQSAIETSEALAKVQQTLFGG